MCTQHYRMRGNKNNHMIISDRYRLNIEKAIIAKTDLPSDRRGRIIGHVKIIIINKRATDTARPNY